MKPEIVQMSKHLNQTQTKIDEVLKDYRTIIDQLSDVHLSPTSQIYFIGNGSSGEGARIASYLVLELFHQNAICVNPYQFVHYNHKGIKADDVVIALSQTGSSHLVVESVRLANQAKAITIALSATKNAPLLKVAQYPLLFEPFVEKVDYKVTGVLGLLYGLWLSVLGLALANEAISEEQLKETVQTFDLINSNYDQLVDVAKTWTENNVERLEESVTLSVLGSGALSEVAMEVAVKSAEIQNRFSVSVDTEEFLHGYCAANPKDNVIVMLVDEASYVFSKKVYEAIKTRNQSIIWIGYQAPENDLRFDCEVSGSFNTACFMPIVHSMLVYWAALKDYGDKGTEIFAYYQDKLSVREE